MRFVVLFLFCFVNGFCDEMEVIANIICHKGISISSKDSLNAIESINKRKLYSLYGRFGNIFFNEVVLNHSDNQDEYLENILDNAIEYSDVSTKIASNILNNEYFDRNSVQFVEKVLQNIPIKNLSVNIDVFQRFVIHSPQVLEFQIYHALINRQISLAKILISQEQTEKKQKYYNALLDKTDRYIKTKDISLLKAGENPVFDQMLFNAEKDIREKILLLGAISDLSIKIQPDFWYRNQMSVVRQILTTRELLNEYSSVIQYIIREGSVSHDKSLFVEYLWLNGYLRYKLHHDYEAAKKYFTRMLLYAKTQVSISKANYWISKSYRHLENYDMEEKFLLEAAKSIYAYYGQIANERLKRNLNVLINNDIINYNNIKTQKVFLGDLLMKVVKLNCDNQIKAVANIFFEQEDIDQYTKAKYIEQVYNINKKIGLALGRMSISKGIVVPKISYPVLSSDISYIEHAIIRQESGFGNSLVSNKNARGFMQIMPETAKMICKKNKIPYNKQRLTFDTKYNMQIARFFIDSLRSKFEHEEFLLAAYNAGPNATNRWLNYLSEEFEINNALLRYEMIEHIPYHETRNYVMRVMEAKRVYESLY